MTLSKILRRSVRAGRVVYSAANKTFTAATWARRLTGQSAVEQLLSSALNLFLPPWLKGAKNVASLLVSHFGKSTQISSRQVANFIKNPKARAKQFEKIQPGLLQMWKDAGHRKNTRTSARGFLYETSRGQKIGILRNIIEEKSGQKLTAETWKYLALAEPEVLDEAIRSSDTIVQGDRDGLPPSPNYARIYGENIMSQGALLFGLGLF